LFFNHETVRSQLEEVERQVMNGQQSSFHAAEALLQAFREQK
jgi:LAO/AO transport system kinase